MIQVTQGSIEVRCPGCKTTTPVYVRVEPGDPDGLTMSIRGSCLVKGCGREMVKEMTAGEVRKILRSQLGH